MFRLWRTAPFVAIVAATALAMGIGFTTTMFAIVRGATRPLPFADAHELVAVEKIVTRRVAGAGPARTLDYVRWRDGSRSFEALGAYAAISLNLAGAGAEPERISGVAITANTFDLLGRPALLGRPLTAEDERPGATPVVVISHRLWLRRFGGEESVLGTTVRLSGVPHVVVGVMPERFGFPINAAFWTGLTPDATAHPDVGPVLQVFGRLADGSTHGVAASELEAITRRVHEETGRAAAAQAVAVRVVPFQDIETPRDVVRALYLLVVAVSFVLLIACGNVANLLLARAAARSREVAIRLALGATRRRLVREQLAETLSLGVVAVAGGVSLATAGTRLFAAGTAHIIEAFWVDFRVDPLVLGFASLLALAATLASGLGPALVITRRNVADVLKDGSAAGGSGVGLVSRGLIAVQVAFACGLLALTLVLARASVNIRSVAWPFDPAKILTFEVQAGAPSADEALRAERIAAIAQAIAGAPGVASAALVTALPGRGAGGWTIALDGARPETSHETTAVAAVTPEFFAVAGARAVAGRLLTWQDTPRAPAVAVVNQSFAARFSPGRDPVGRMVSLGSREFSIVGVVPDLVARDVQERRHDGLYVPLLQFGYAPLRVMASGAGDPLALMPSIRSSLRRLDPDLPIAEVFTLREAVYRDKRVLDVLSLLFLIFGVGALLLTAIGLFGVVSFTVTQRTRELGIRLALGATPLRILGLVLWQGSRQLLIGLAVGSVLAVALSRAFAAAVEQLPGADAPLLLAITAALSLTALAALAVPAVRAARLPIVRALR